jgi:hypothetical protein
MSRTPLLSILLLFSINIFSQQYILVFKKGHKTIEKFFKTSVIAFQVSNKEWEKGFVTGIGKDSFYIRPFVVNYGLMKIDTVQYEELGFALTEVYAMPKNGVLVDFIDGRFQPSRSGGHLHWYWIKSGWIFRVIGAGYATLTVVNGLIDNDLSLQGSKLGLAAGIFLFGVFLKYNYKYSHRLKHKYRLEIY